MSFFFMPALSCGLPQQEPLLRSSLAPRGGQCPTPHQQLLSLFFFATITIISLVVVFGRTPKKNSPTACSARTLLPLLSFVKRKNLKLGTFTERCGGETRQRNRFSYPPTPVGLEWEKNHSAGCDDRKLLIKFDEFSMFRSDFTVVGVKEFENCRN